MWIKDFPVAKKHGELWLECVRVCVCVCVSGKKKKKRACAPKRQKCIDLLAVTAHFVDRLSDLTCLTEPSPRYFVCFPRLSAHSVAPVRGIYFVPLTFCVFAWEDVSAILLASMSSYVWGGWRCQNKCVGASGIFWRAHHTKWIKNTTSNRRKTKPVSNKSHLSYQANVCLLYQPQ